MIDSFKQKIMITLTDMVKVIIVIFIILGPLCLMLNAQTPSKKVNEEFIKILDLDSTYNVSSIVYFNNDFFFSSRKGVFKIDKKNKKAILLDKGLIKSNDKRESKLSATKLILFEQELYAAFLFNGVFKYDEKKELWKPVKTGLTDSTLFDLTECNGKLYAPTYNDGLFELSSNKKLWVKKGSKKERSLTACACVDNVLWVGNAGNNLYRYNNKSEELKLWKNFKEADVYNNDIIGFGVLCMEQFDSTFFVSVHMSGIFRSNDLGYSWEKEHVKFHAGCLYKYDNKLLMGHFGSKEGLYVYDTKTNKINTFNTGLKGSVRHMTSIGDMFYIVTHNGMYQMTGANFSKLLENNFID